jgi:hypothetical protein
MSTIIIIIALLFAALVMATTIYDCNHTYQYYKYQSLAESEFGVSKEEFDGYIEFAKSLYGNKDIYRNAYFIAGEEWYDEHYK